MLALQHGENCQYLPSFDIRSPTIKRTTTQCFSWRCVWDDFQDFRMIKKTLNCYSLSLWNKPSDLKQGHTLSKHFPAISSTWQFKFADWTNKLTQTFYKLDERFYTLSLSKHSSFQIGAGFPQNFVPRDALRQPKLNFWPNRWFWSLNYLACKELLK